MDYYNKSCNSILPQYIIYHPSKCFQSKSPFNFEWPKYSITFPKSPEISLQ